LNDYILEENIIKTFPKYYNSQYEYYFTALYDYVMNKKKSYLSRIIIDGEKYISLNEYIYTTQLKRNIVSKTHFAFYNTAIKQGIQEFNQPVTLIEGATDFKELFKNAFQFNQPINIPDSIEDTKLMFSNCFNFNQKVVIKKALGIRCWKMFNKCERLDPKNVEYILCDHFPLIEGLFNAEENESVSKRLILVCPKLSSQSITVNYRIDNGITEDFLELYRQLKYPTNLSDIIYERGVIEIKDESLFAQMLLAKTLAS